jgi:predicted 3-demethylubiquinone-9 3-methyltransferase (glyoxalase superfamily)
MRLIMCVFFRDCEFPTRKKKDTMILSIFPCLWFDGQAKEAAEFYCATFRNSFITAETPLVVTFTLNGSKIMGLNGGPLFRINPSISLFVNCETLEEADRIWNILIEEGSSMIPMNEYPWSKRYGWLQDKYGLTWQISWYGNDLDTFRIVPAMLFTGDQFGQASEAIRLYSSIFKNTSTEMMVVYPEGDPNAGKTMYSEFMLNQSLIIAMDGPGDHNFNFNEGVSFVVECETQAEIDFLWAKLSEGGEESMCGWLKDKFGVSWQIVPAVLAQIMSDPVKAPLAMQAFLKMRKLDIAKIIKETHFKPDAI